MTTWVRKNRVWLIIALLLPLIIPWAISPREAPGDISGYVLLSREILDTHSYPMARFPPVFPLMLTPITYFFGYNIVAMQLLLAALAVVTLYICYRLIRTLANESYATLVVALVGTSPVFITLVAVVSDLPFLLFILLALLFLNRYSPATGYRSGNLYLGVMFVLLAFFTKTAGLALVMAALVYFAYLLILRNAPRKQVLLALLLIIVPVALWVYFRLMVNQDYFKMAVGKDIYTFEPLSWKELLVSRLVAAKNTVYYVAKTAIYGFDLSLLRYLRVAATPLIVGLLLWGYLRRHLRAITAIEYFIFFYLVMIVLFYHIEMRHYLALLPFVAYYLPLGMKAVSDRILPQRMAQLAFTIAIALVLLSNLAFDAREISRPVRPEWADYKAAARWLADNSPADSVVMTYQANWVNMWTNRETMLYAYSKDISKVLEPIYKGEVDYVIVDAYKDWTTQKYLIPAMRSDMDRFEPVYQVGETIVYKVKK